MVTAAATASGFGGTASATEGFGPAFLVAAAIALTAAGIAALTLREPSAAADAPPTHALPNAVQS